MWRCRRFRIIWSLRPLGLLPQRRLVRRLLLRRPRGDLPSFMGFYTLGVLTELEQWAVDARAALSQPESRLEEPEVSYNVKVFLKFTLGPQWELKLLRQSGEVLFDQLRAYLAGYNQLTSFMRR